MVFLPYQLHEIFSRQFETLSMRDCGVFRFYSTEQSSEKDEDNFFITRLTCFSTFFFIIKFPVMSLYTLDNTRVFIISTSVSLRT